MEIRCTYEDDYDGDGVVLAAVKNNEVVGLRYLADFVLTRSSGCEWVEALCRAANVMDERQLPNASDKATLNRMANAARKCADCPKPLRGRSYVASELLDMVRAELSRAHVEKFAIYKEECRKQLAQLGEVVEGNVVGFEFLPTKKD
jgi:hypothetical protein